MCPIPSIVTTVTTLATLRSLGSDAGGEAGRRSHSILAGRQRDRAASRIRTYSKLLREEAYEIVRDADECAYPLLGQATRLPQDQPGRCEESNQPPGARLRFTLERARTWRSTKFLMVQTQGGRKGLPGTEPGGVRQDWGGCPDSSEPKLGEGSLTRPWRKPERTEESREEGTK